MTQMLFAGTVTSNAMSLGATPAARYGSSIGSPLTVIGSPGTGARDAVTGQPDEALDEVLVGVGRVEADVRQGGVDRTLQRAGLRDDVGGQPAPGVLEHDDVTAAQVERARRQLAHQDPVVAR